MSSPCRSSKTGSGKLSEVAADDSGPEKLLSPLTLAASSAVSAVASLRRLTTRCLRLRPCLPPRLPPDMANEEPTRLSGGRAEFGALPSEAAENAETLAVEACELGSRRVDPGDRREGRRVLVPDSAGRSSEGGEVAARYTTSARRGVKRESVRLASRRAAR